MLYILIVPENLREKEGLADCLMGPVFFGSTMLELPVIVSHLQ